MCYKLCCPSPLPIQAAVRILWWQLSESGIKEQRRKPGEEQESGRERGARERRREGGDSGLSVGGGYCLRID